MNRLSLITNYLILAIILGIGMYAYFMMQGNRSAQLIIGIVIAAAYAIWGVLHQWTAGNLHRKVVIEYVLIGAIAVTVLMIILGR